MLLSHGLRAAARKPPVVTYKGSSVNTTDATSYTFASSDIGTASSNRLVVVVTSPYSSSASSSGITVSSVTVGGTSLTKYNKNGDTGGGGREFCSVWAGIISTGTSANIVVNTSTTSLCCGIAWYVIDNAINWNVEASPNAIQAMLTTSSGSYTFSSVGVNDVVLFSSRIRSANVGTYTLTNVTENYEQIIESGNSGYLGGVRQITSAQSNYQVSWSTSGSGPLTSPCYTRFYFT